MKKIFLFAVLMTALLSGCKGGGGSNGHNNATEQDIADARMREQIAQYAGTYEIYVDNRFIDVPEIGYTTLSYVTVNKDGSCDIEGEGEGHYDDCTIMDNMLVMAGGDIAFQLKPYSHTIDLPDDFRRQDREEHGGMYSIIMAPAR